MLGMQVHAFRGLPKFPQKQSCGYDTLAFLLDMKFLSIALRTVTPAGLDWHLDRELQARVALVSQSESG